MKRLLPAFLVLLALSCMSVSGATSYYFFVQFSNKKNTTYSLASPSAFLSSRAIARRVAFGISCDSTDLPVNQSYVNQVANLGAKIHSRSKWMNSVTVLVADSSLMSQVRALPFVNKVQYTGKTDAASLTRQKSKFETQLTDYGSAQAQLNQINGSYIHSLGYTGKGIHVGVLDGGFSSVNTNPGFDSLRLSGRLLGTKDIAEINGNVYAMDAHGANVLSIMTGRLGGATPYAGTAPHASFWLIRTEYAPTEYLVETDFWVSGIEFADSVGVDVVNSSLGYTTFDDTKMNFTYADMNGKISRASKAATLAAQKGIIVCNSAGNDGNKTWHYIGSPADAEGIVSVGAVYNTGVSSEFSSYGPSSDNRVKPEICGTGTATAYITTAGTRASGNGTSYSSPVIAGMMACYLQYAKANFSNLTVPKILESVFKSGSIYANPTAQLGYGIPDFQKAAGNLLTLDVSDKKYGDNFGVVYRPESSLLELTICEPITQRCALRIYSVAGILVYSDEINQQNFSRTIKGLAAGAYIVNVSSAKFNESQKIIIR